MSQELVLRRGRLGTEGGYDRGARGAVLDGNPHARALPRLGQNLFFARRCTEGNLFKVFLRRLSEY